MLVPPTQNPFEIRKQKFFRAIQKYGIMKRHALIVMLGVTPDMFQREYKSYMEPYQGIIKYNKKTQSFLYDTNDIVIDHDGCTGRAEMRRDYQQTIVS